MSLTARITNTVHGMIAEKRSGTRHFHRHDPLGSVIGLINDSATTTDTYTYWPYGTLQSSTGSTQQPWKFVGKYGYYTDSATHTYVRARKYRKDLGRWLTVDPLWPEESAYGYADGNPELFVDEDGLMPCTARQALKCYWLCGSQNARYTGTCTAEYRGFGVTEVDCHCEPLLPNCKCDPPTLAKLSLRVALTCAVPRACSEFLAMPPNKARCAAIILRITAGLGCIYAQQALNNQCFGGGDQGHRQKIQQAQNAINTCSRALAFNKCGPYPR